LSCNVAGVVFLRTILDDLLPPELVDIEAGYISIGLGRRAVVFAKEDLCRLPRTIS
jgi:hypothetical protein